MNQRNALLVAAGLMAVAGIAGAQTPPPAPTFAASNLTEKGVRGLAASCTACHGTNGRAAPGSELSSLAGRSQADLRLALGQFRDGKRAATVMHQIAKGYSDAEFDALASFFSKQPR